MRFDPKNYDEQSELANYVYRFYGDLFTEAERRGPGFGWLRRNVSEASAEDIQAVLNESANDLSNPDIRHALLLAIDEFFDKAVQRVLRECGKAIDLNRCPQCERIVASPKARQCLWCGAGWHNTES